MNQATARWVVIEPLDTVAVRDGRAFNAGVNSTASAVVPQPSTVAGALGTALGTRPDQVRGPVVVRRVADGHAGGTRWEPLFPIPRDVVAAKGREHGPWTLLAPDEFRGSAHDLAPAEADDGAASGLRLLAGDGDPVTGWWDRHALRRYLHDRVAGTHDPREAPKAPPPWVTEYHVGLMRRDRSAVDGFLYAALHLRPHDGVGFAAEVVAAPSVPSETVFFGGEGRRAQVHVCPPAGGAAGETAGGGAAPVLPGTPGDFPGGRVLLYLVTSALFASGWLPDASRLGEGCQIAAAALDGPQVVATATPDRETGGFRDQRLRWAVAAGSVYYLQFPSDQAARHAARLLHGRLLPQADDPLVTAGFGLTLTGRWS